MNNSVSPSVKSSPIMVTLPANYIKTLKDYAKHNTIPVSKLIYISTSEYMERNGGIPKDRITERINNFMKDNPFAFSEFGQEKEVSLKRVIGVTKNDTW